MSTKQHLRDRTKSGARTLKYNQRCTVIDAPSDLGPRPTGVAGLPEALREARLLESDRFVVFGFRDADLATQHDSPDVRKTSMHVMDLAAVRRLGPASAARHGIAALEAAGVEGIWIHLDADVLNDEVMPAVDYRMADGLSPEELTDALAVVLSSPLAIGMDLTIYNPMLDDADHSAARVLAQAVSAAFVRGQSMHE